MIIFGVRTTESASVAGVFPCPRCRTEQDYRLLVHKRWFTLYFVPVIPLGRAGEQVECQTCLSRFSPDVLFAGMPDKPYIAQLGGDMYSAPPKPAPHADLPETSSLSITSLILGLLSPPLLCLCGLSLISSLAAVVTGHLALLQIGRSAGRLSGQGLAVAGLVLGYVLLAASLGVWTLLGPSLYRGWRDAGRPMAEAHATATPENASQRRPAFVPEEDRATATSPPGPPGRIAGPREPSAELYGPPSGLPEDAALQPRFGPGFPPFPPLPVFRPPGGSDAGRGGALPGNPVIGEPAARPSPSAPSGDADHVAATLPSVGDVVQRFPDMGWPVESLAFSPQGRYLAVGKLDALLLLLDVAKGCRLQTVSLREELGQVQCVAFSLDGGTLFAGGYRGRLQAWNVDDAGRLQPADSLQGHTQAVTCLATSPVAPFLLSGSAAGDLVWQSYERASAEPRRLAAFERSVLAVQLPQSGVLAWATDGQRLIQFDLGSAQIVKVSELARSGAQAAAFSPDGSTLAVSQGREIRLVDTRTGIITRTLTSGHEMQWSLLFLRDGQRLVSGGRGAATLWSLADGQPLGRIDLGGVLYIKSLAAAGDGDLLAAIPSAAGQTLSVLRLPEFPPRP